MNKKSQPRVPSEGPVDNADLKELAIVRLRPVAGITPATYLTIALGIAILFTLFLTLLYPGLRNTGGHLDLTTRPPNVTVNLNGRLAGTTPLSVNIRPGQHKVTLSRTGFKPVTLSVDIPKRVIATLIWPNRIQQHLALQLIDGAGTVDRRVAEYAAASHLNNIIEDAGNTLADASPVNKYAFLYEIVHFIDRRQALGSLSRAAATTASNGGPITPQATRILFEWFSQLNTDYPGLPFWLASNLSEELNALPSAQNFFDNHADSYSQILINSNNYLQINKLQSDVSVNGIVFRSVPSGILLMGDDADRPVPPERIHDHQPHLRKINAFLMAETEVTNRQFAQFIAEVPRWSPDGKESLVNEGVTNPNYLSSWQNGLPPVGDLDKPVTHVPYQAATAFAEWLNSALKNDPISLSGKLIVRLPTEAEWEWAARGGLRRTPYPDGKTPGNAQLANSRNTGPATVPTSQPNGYGLYDLLGNVWEWTDTWYAPASYLLAAGSKLITNSSTAPSIGAERVIRGGSWATDANLIRVFSRGAQEPTWTTSYIGFRVVLGPQLTSDG